MVAPQPLTQAFETQARVCRAMGSPFSSSLLERGAADLGSAGPTLALTQAWRDASVEAIFQDAVPLRWLGAVHDLALSDEAPTLTATWPRPDHPGDEVAAWRATAAAMTERAGRFAAFMRHEPQTNEVRRSACLLGGFLEVARATGLPLRTFELGASAGLNQLWDRYRYDLGSAGAWGDLAAAVRIDTDWRGPPPPLSARVAVVARAACDRKPIRLDAAEDRRRLRAYVWAGQFDRLARLDAAASLAVAAGVRVEAADALAFTRDEVFPEPGAATVLYHSVFWQYLPAPTRQDLAQEIAGIGARAAVDAPFAWLRMEPTPPSTAEMEVRLTLWPGGEERRLARCHAHGAWVEWEAG